MPKSATPAELTPVGAPLPLETYQQAAAVLLAYRVGGYIPGKSQRATTDRVYLSGTERRVGPKYSSCGDLAHDLWFRLGVRSEWINRDEHTGRKYRNEIGKPWRVGWNLTYLAPGAGNPIAHAARGLKEAPRFQPGDLFEVSTIFGGHMICVMSVDPADPFTIITAEYGQANIGPGAGKCKTHKITLNAKAGLTFCGSAQIKTWCLLADAVALLPSSEWADLDLATLAQAKAALEAGSAT